MIDENKKTMLPDAEEMQLNEENRSEEERKEKVVQLWNKRFKQAEDFRRPYIDRNIRMYKLYRAYRDVLNYAYGTNIMPPTGFEIIETVKPRLASAKIKVNINPKGKENLENENISKWDDLVEYNLQEMKFDSKKIEWINAQLMYGNGTIQPIWAGNFVDIDVVDNFLFYPDPKAQNRLSNSRWEIKQAFKAKAVIEKEEKKREDEKLYDENELAKVDDEQSTGDDPRRDRYQINTLKMGQIDSGKQRKGEVEPSRGSATNDKEFNERTVEIWECYDHVEEKIITIMNRKHLVREDENTYEKVNDGIATFIDLPNITLNWEYYAMSILEPVETVIHEIADSRNQAMDDIVFSLDPIRKVKKGRGYKEEDLKHAPGAIWYLQQADDVVIERGPEISSAWVEKDNMLRREIQTSLALSEYTQGIPQSSSEPASKVEMLLMQTNVRFSLIVRQYEEAMTELVNNIIKMNQAFLTEDVSMRILGDNFRFAEFTQQDKEIGVDAWVAIEPDKEKTVEQQAKEALELYTLLIVDDKPEANQPKAVAKWQKKKALLQQMIVQKFGYEDYEDILAPEWEPEDEPTPAPETTQNEPGGEVGPMPTMPEGGLATMQPGAEMPQPEPMLPLEGQVDGVGVASGAKPGLLQRLLGR